MYHSLLPYQIALLNSCEKKYIIIIIITTTKHTAIFRDISFIWLLVVEINLGRFALIKSASLVFVSWRFVLLLGLFWGRAHKVLYLWSSTVVESSSGDLSIFGMSGMILTKLCASKHVDTEHKRWITMTETVLPKASGQDDDRRVWHMELRKTIRTN